MIRILLIRHGETELTGRLLYGRMPGVHLSAEGHRQGEALGKFVKANYRVDELISSPLERAMETAHHLSLSLNLPILTEEKIIELDYGAWLGKSFGEIRESDYWKHYNRLRSLLSPPEGELMLQVQTRALEAVNKLMAAYSKKDSGTVVMVSHGDVIRGLLILLLGIPLDNIHRLEVAPGSLSEVLFDAHYPRVVRINQLPC